MPILDNQFTKSKPDAVFEDLKPKDTLASLRDDDEFVKRTERFLDSLSSQYVRNQGKDVGDLYQFFRGTDWNLKDATALGIKASNFTDEQKEDYNYLRTRWDNASVGGKGPERRQLALDATQEILTDPANWASALLVPWTAGSSVVGKIAAGEAAKLTIKEAVKTGVKQTVKTGIAKGASLIPGQTLKSPLTAKQTYGIVSLEGTAYGGTFDYVHQSVDLATHRRDKRDLMRTVKVAATTGILAPTTFGAIKGVTYTVPKFMKAVNEERIARIDNNENYKSNYAIKLTTDLLDKIELSSKMIVYGVGVLPLRPTSLFKAKSSRDKDLNTLLKIFRYDADEFFIAPKPGEQKLLDLDYNQSLNKLFGNRQEELYSIILKYKLREHHSVLNPIKGDKNLKTKVKRILSSPTVKQVLSEETDLDLAYYLRTGNTTKFVNGKQIKLADNIIGAGKEMRKLLDNIYNDAVKLGLNPNKVPDYFPRAWRIDKIKANKDDFIERIIKAEGSTFSSAEKLWKQLATEGSPESSSNVGLSKTRLKAERRLLKLKDKDFADYLSNDVENVLLKYIGETSALLTRTELLGEDLSAFTKRWINKIEKNNNIKLTQFERDQLKLMYEVTTGQKGRIDTSKKVAGLPTGAIGAGLNDLLTVSMQTSMLGFSAITSLVEIGVPLLLGANYKVGTDAFKRAANQSGKEFWNKQKANFGIGNPNKEIRPADRLDLNAFMNSINLGAEDRITAIYGQAVSRPATKIQNVFFKTVGLHDLTRFLQLVGYDMGKNLIYKNLKTLVDNPNLNPTNKKLLQDQLAELGIDANEGVKWVQRGGEHTDDYYLNQVRAGANRYTNEVVMNPTAASNQKPLIHSLASTKWMYGLLGYITAFSNGPLRKVVRNLTKDARSVANGANPFSGGGNISTGRAVTGAAFMYSIGLLNYTLRTGGRNYEDLESGKISEEDFVKRTLAYSGLLGPAEMYMRYEFAERYENKIIAGIGSFTGPNVADIVDYLTQFSQRGAVAEIVLKRLPFSVALKSTHPEIYQQALEEARRIDKEVLGLKGELPERPLENPLPPIRQPNVTGGLITGPEVTDTKENPADRVDPFTGMPYADQMARLGFNVGGIIARQLVKPKITSKELVEKLSPTKTFDEKIDLGLGEVGYAYKNKNKTISVTLKDANTQDFDTPYSINDVELSPDIELDFIGNISKNTNKGLASKELDKILKEVDSRDMSMTLNVDSAMATRNTKLKGLSDKDLIKWYERKGFIFEEDSLTGYRPAKSENKTLFKLKVKKITKEESKEIEKYFNRDFFEIQDSFISDPMTFKQLFSAGKLKKGYINDGTNNIFYFDGKTKPVKISNAFLEYDYKTNKHKVVLKNNKPNQMARLGFSQGGNIDEVLAKQLFNIDAKWQRNHEAESADLVNRKIDEGIFPERARIPVNPHTGWVEMTNQTDEEIFNKVNHQRLAYKLGDSNLKFAGLQVREGLSVAKDVVGRVSGKDSKDNFKRKLLDSQLDFLNNRVGFNLRKKGLTLEEAENEIVNNTIIDFNLQPKELGL